MAKVLMTTYDLSPNYEAYPECPYGKQKGGFNDVCCLHRERVTEFCSTATMANICPVNWRKHERKTTTDR